MKRRRVVLVVDRSPRTLIQALMDLLDREVERTRKEQPNGKDVPPRPFLRPER